ncbi:MAG TPA: glycosyltransferase family 4 protein [Nitrospirae bacterium]|nr:glycosyltransferase family 4 protein [Nitrospirota bacterium]
MKLAFTISTLSQGGAERVITNMANHWAGKGHEVTILTLSVSSINSFFKLDSSIKVVGLAAGRSSKNPFEAVINNARRIFAIRKTLKTLAPDILISFMTETNILSIISTVGLSFPVIVSERANPKVYPNSIIWKLLRSVVYPIADKIILQSEASKDNFSGIIKKKCAVIPNPVSYVKDSKQDFKVTIKQKKTIVSLGRLVEEKGYDLLLNAFSRIRAHHNDWSLVIYGDGPLRGQLEGAMDELKLSDAVQFPGITNDPTEALLKADLFVLSSTTEGFPNALCEAMACGLPVISFDCLYWPAEIIDNGKNGILVPTGDVNKLAEAMEALINDNDHRETLAKEARKITERLGADKIMEAWSKLIDKLV